MKYNKIYFLIIFLFISNCVNNVQNNKKELIVIKDQYSNKGFTLVYNDDLFNSKVVSKKIDNRSYLIFNRNLKRNSNIKITNLLNGKSLIAKVKSNKVDFPSFYNSVITERISQDLEISLDEPYIEIQLINNNSSFVAKKTKTFDEERNVAEKAPIDGIIINDLNRDEPKEKNTKIKKVIYSIKVADFYYEKSAQQMISRIKNETKINKYKVIKLSDTNFRVILGPFSDIKSLEDSYTKATILNFDNLEILRND